MFVMADAYFHSGYYPSIFDRQVTEHDVAEPAHGKAEDEDSTSDDFLGPPPDWIAALDRQFVPNQHTHLSSGGPSGHMKAAEVQEILPWLKLATDMNPQFIRAYTGRATIGCAVFTNPRKPGTFCSRVCTTIPATANSCSIWAGFTRKIFTIPTVPVTSGWRACAPGKAQSANAKTNPETQLVYEETAMNLARLEESQGNWPQAIKYLEMVKQVSPNPDAIQKQIDEAERKVTGGK